MSLKCCNKVCQIIEEIDLLDIIGKTHRLLIIGRCKNPKCGALKAQILYYDTVLNKFIYKNIKSKNIKKTINEIKNNPLMSIITKDKQGSYQNQNWIYGKTINRKEGSTTYIEHWAYNFNGEKKLIERKIQNESINSAIINN